MFTGLSSLRKAEKKPPSAENKALQAYLQRYADGPAGGDGDGKKRKKKRPKQPAPSAVAIVDADVSGFAPLEAPQQARRGLDAAAASSEEPDDEGPVIANPEQAEAFRLQIEKSKNFYAKGEDGSGWAAADAEEPARQARRQRPHDSPQAATDLSPPRRRRHDTPPRSAAAGANGHGAAAGSPDLSPPRRGRARHDSPPDASPPRRRQRHDSPEPAAAGGSRRAGAAEAAAAGQGGSPDLSPPRRCRHDSPADASPPRRGRHDSPADASPLRRGRHDSPADASPPRRGRHDSPADASPPRRGRHDSPADASPPRRGRHDSPADASPPRRPAAAAAGAGSQPGPRMGDGTTAGLVTSQQLAVEAAQMRAAAEERKRAAKGKGEATVYRDKATGAAISAEEYAAQVAKAKQRKPPAEEIQVAWKGGLAQQRAAAEAAAAAAREAAKRFDRGFDVDADSELRGRDRWGDPMAGKLQKRKGGDAFDLPPPVLTDANREAMESSGFVVPQEVPPHSWLRRGVAAPINRYGIKPGRHWDGVDRSTGFEKAMFKQLNQRRAQDLEARLWMQEDL